MRLKYLQLKVWQRGERWICQCRKARNNKPVLQMQANHDWIVRSECECVCVPKSHVLENASWSMFTSFPSSQNRSGRRIIDSYNSNAGLSMKVTMCWRPPQQWWPKTTQPWLRWILHVLKGVLFVHEQASWRVSLSLNSYQFGMSFSALKHVTGVLLLWS